MNDADKDKYAYKSPEQLINEGLVAPPSLAMDEHGRCIYSDAFKAWARGRFPLMNVEAGNKDLDMAWVGWNAALAHRDAQHAEVMRRVRAFIDHVAVLNSDPCEPISRHIGVIEAKNAAAQLRETLQNT